MNKIENRNCKTCKHRDNQLVCLRHGSLIYDLFDTVFELTEISCLQWNGNHKIENKNIQLLRETIIEKWMPIFFGRETKASCSLCDEYAPSTSIPGSILCGGCPIRKYTGDMNCNETPFWTLREKIEAYVDNEQDIYELPDEIKKEVHPFVIEEVLFLFKILRIERRDQRALWGNIGKNQ